MIPERTHFRELIENYISDCLLPSTHKKDRKTGTELYELFEQYCTALEIDVPVDIRVFGRELGKHFVKTNHGNKSAWCVKYRRGVIEG